MAIAEPTRAADEQRVPVHMRVPARARELIDTAAAIEGKSRTEFVLDSACRHAREVLLDQRLFMLNAEQHDRVMRLLDNPPPPTDALRRLLLATPPWKE